MRIAAAAALLCAVLVLAGAADASNSLRRAVVTWKVGGETFRTYLNRPDEVAKVRRAIRRHQTAGIPIGRIHRGTRENRCHRWHLRDVRLAEVTTEVCDGRPSDIDADLGYWAGTVRRYCPWSARPIRLRWA